VKFPEQNVPCVLYCVLSTWRSVASPITKHCAVGNVHFDYVQCYSSMHKYNFNIAVMSCFKWAICACCWFMFRRLCVGLRVFYWNPTVHNDV